jgi:hypothetical protein
LVIHEAADGRIAMSRFIAEVYANHGPLASRHEAVIRRFFALLARLSLANVRLVAHVAKGSGAPADRRL